MTQRACFMVAPIGAKRLGQGHRPKRRRILNAEANSPPGALPGSVDLVAPANANISVDPWMSPSLLIETGFALGRSVPVLLVGVASASFPAFENEPALGMLLRVRTKITDAASLRFHIPTFLDRVKKSLDGPMLTPPTPPLGAKTGSTAGWRRMLSA